MQRPSLRSTCIGTAFVFAILSAAPAAALPVTWKSVDDAREPGIARLIASLDRAAVPDRPVVTFAPDRETANIADDVVRPRNRSSVARNDDDWWFNLRSSNRMSERSSSPAQVPEPATLLLTGIGAVLGLRRALGRH
jgi:hypothetical protein